MNNIIFGIDASSTCTGISVFNKEKLIDFFEISSNKPEWHERLKEQKSKIEDIFKKYNPTTVYMEDVPLEKRSSKNLLILGGVQGFLFDICLNYNAEIIYIPPTRWRSELKMFDGTKKGKTREVLKEKAIKKANEMFNLELVWNGPNSKKTQDDVAEAILIGFFGTMNSRIHRKFGK